MSGLDHATLHKNVRARCTRTVVGGRCRMLWHRAVWFLRLGLRLTGSLGGINRVGIVGWGPSYSVDQIVMLTTCCLGYLDDAHSSIRIAFPLLFWATPAFHPLRLLDPVANYVLLRCMGADEEISRARQSVMKKQTFENRCRVHGRLGTEEGTSFWPARLHQPPADIKNPWLWTFVGLGVIAGVSEEAARRQ